MDDDIDCDEPTGDYESGPFCVGGHYHDTDCKEVCQCGHECRNHGYGYCDHDDCDCDGFRDPPDPEVPHAD